MDTYSEEYRRACEVRYALAMEQFKRRAYYEEVLKRRGKEAANELIAAVNKLGKEQHAKGQT